MVKPPYPRPVSLSDPFSDFTPELLRALLAVPDEEMKWHQYQHLLGPHLPAGTYNESVYFLPGAFRMLREEHEHSLDLTTAVIGFVSKNASELERDGLLESARDEVRECLGAWTSEFKVIHFDREACREKEWKLDHFDYVQNVETVCETLCDLERFDRHVDLADEFIVRLASPVATPVQSAWFLELARAQADVRKPPLRPAFQGLFNDVDKLVSKRDAVKKGLAASIASPTYWRETLEQIGILD